MNIKLRRNIFLILVIVNCIIIFLFSNQVADDSGATSGKLVELIIKIIPQLDAQREILHFIVRKLAHFSIYTLLGILIMNYVLTYKRSLYQSGITSLFFGFVYAITDEIHQLFIEGRSCEFRDVCIDTLGVLTGILIVVIITKIYRKLSKKQKEKIKISKDTKVLFISSTGGHFNELMQLSPLFDKCNYLIVTEKIKSNKSLKNKYKDKIKYLLYGTKRTPFKYMFILLGNCFISLYIYLKFRPQVIVSTGTHTAGPMCCIGKILGSKIIYVETFANRTTKTAAGRLVYYIADTFVVQWEEMTKLYPKAKYWGWIY